MSNIEHLIENALVNIENKYPHEDFFDAKHNIEMAKACNINLEDVYEMAIYVYYTYIPSIRWNLEKKLRKEYGY